MTSIAKELEVGGKPIIQGKETAWWFGWCSPDQAFGEHHIPTPELQHNHRETVANFPAFQISGQWRSKPKVVLWDAAKKAYTKHLECFHQDVGSCVGQGKAKAEWYLMCCEILQGQPTKAVMPFEPYGYAQSRVCAGISGNQDGSTGAGAAEAAKAFGVLASTAADLPKWRQEGQTIYWPGDIDRSWGQRGSPNNFVTEGKLHVVKTTAQIRSVDDVVEAIQNFFPVTIASNWGGLMSPPLVGTPSVRLNHRSGVWGHQMMICGYWDHPTLKEIFYIQNSWGENAHGNPANDEPPGGFWVSKADVASIVSQRDSFVYSQFVGFPGDATPWVF